MGETSGYLVDPKSARAVLEALESILDIEVGFEQLEDRADEMEAVVAEMQGGEGGTGTTASEENLRYFG
jgi:proteasome assembly chaperone (PAC2) family protein